MSPRTARAAALSKPLARLGKTKRKYATKCYHWQRSAPAVTYGWWRTTELKRKRRDRIGGCTAVKSSRAFRLRCSSRRRTLGLNQVTSRSAQRCGRCITGLYSYIDEEEIRLEDVDDLEAKVKADSELASRLLHFVSGEVKRLAEQSRLRGEFRCAVEEVSLSKHGTNHTETVLKKLVSLSTTSYIHCGEISQDDDVSPGGLVWRAFGRFLRFAIRYRSLVESNLVIPTAIYAQRNSDMGGIECERTYIGKDSLKVNLDLTEIEQQFFEFADNSNRPPVGAVEIFLPHLSGIDMNAILRLRQSEEDAFIRYHRHLTTFFDESARANNERKILHCLQKIDEGVRETQTVFNAVRSKNIYSGLG